MWATGIRQILQAKQKYFQVVKDILYFLWYFNGSTQVPRNRGAEMKRQRAAPFFKVTPHTTKHEEKDTKTDLKLQQSLKHQTLLVLEAYTGVLPLASFLPTSAPP